MSILVPKVHQDGSQIGMHGREWSNVISNVTYTSSSFIDGANILSGTHGLEVDERLLVVSPYPTADVQASLTGDIVPLRINNLLAAADNYDMGGYKITNLGSPTAEGDAAPKSYVDQAITGLKWKQSVKGSSVDKASPSTIYWKDFEEATWTGSEQAGYTQTSYGNPGWIFTDSGGVQKLELRRPRQSRLGSDSYGLNINTSNLFWNDGTSQQDHPIDEYLFDDVNTFKNGERVLVNVFQDASRNGIYEFESTGSSPTEITRKPVLVRADDFNLTSEVSSAAVFIEEGTQNADTAFVCTTNNTDIEDVLIGTYNIDWTVYGTQAVDNVTIYKDTTQSERLEVTGVLRDINDIYYNYGTGARLNVDDGQFLVGNGVTFVAEKDNVVRTSMGLGTGNSPTFTNLTLTGGELTASHFVSNTGNSTDPITLSSPLSGTVALTANSIALDTSVTSNTLTTAGNATIHGTLAVNGQLSANENIVVANTKTISGAKSISAQFVTASVALSASYMQLREFANVTDFTNLYPTNNSLYIADDALYFDGEIIGGAGASQGQPKENALFYGGNIVSDKGTSHSINTYYMRMGVSGSHQDASTDAAGRSLDFQILTGSFSELTGSKVDIDGGTIDNVVGNFTSINTSNATITGGAITDTSISGSTGIFSTLEADTADINGGTIDGTTIGDTTPAKGTFNPLNSPAVAITGGAITDTSISGSTGDFSTLKADTADINGGTIDGTTIGATTPAVGKFTEITGSVEIDGGRISNTIIDNTNTIQINTADYTTGIFTDLTASNFIMPKTGDQGYVDVTVSNTTQDSQISHSGGAKLRIVATDLTASDALIQDGSITADFGSFAVLTGSDVDINGGTINVEFGSFAVLSGSDADIDKGTIDNTIIGLDAPALGKFTQLTGSHVHVSNELSASVGATIDFNNNLVQNVATVDLSAGQRKDAVNREYIDTVVGIKTKVRLAASSNVDPANVSLSDDIDGAGALALADGDRILLTNQDTNSENGIYVFDNNATPKLQRPFDYLAGDNAGGFVVLVEEGTANGQSIFSLKSSGVVDTADITVTKISSQYGVSSEGKGISKNVNIFSVNLQDGDWDSDTPADRANLTFHPVTGETDKLILSSSVRVDELKVVDSTGASGRVQISGSADSYIDNVQIGMNAQAAAKFNNINLTAGTMVLESATKITGSAGATSKIELSEGRFDKLSVPDVITMEETSTPEELVTIHGSFKLDNNKPADRAQRLYLDGGDLYFENHKIGSGGGSTTAPGGGTPTILSDFTSIFVTGSQADGHGAFISGSMIVEGDLQIRGTTTTVSSSNTTLQDSIIGLGITGSHSGNEEFNNLGDRGIIFARGANQTDALPGMWWDGLKFQFAKSVTSPSSGSFGAVTQRSTVKTGDVDALEVTATEVTASAGLNIGGNTGFNFPTTDGTIDQILKTDGFGKLQFVDMDHSFKLQRSNLTITTDPTITSTTTQEFDMNGVDTDVFVMDFTGRDTTSNAYTSTSLRWLTIRVKNLSSDFHRPGKNFYVGIRGFNHDNFQSSAVLLLRLGFVFADAITGYKRDGALYSSTGIKTTFIRGGNVYTSATPNTYSSSDEAARFQFSAGSENANTYRPWSALLDRVDTDDSKIYCLKFSVTQGVGTTALEWRANFDEIVTFDNDDPRLT